MSFTLQRRGGGGGGGGGKGNSWANAFGCLTLYKKIIKKNIEFLDHAVQYVFCSLARLSNQKLRHVYIVVKSFVKLNIIH